MAPQVTGWAKEVTAGGGRFARSEPRRQAPGYVRGLLSGERKSGWQLAEHLDDPTPNEVQHRWPGPTWMLTTYATT